MPARAKAGGQPGEVLGLDGATGGIGLGIEVEDELAALEVRQRHLAAAIARQLEAGGLATDG